MCESPSSLSRCPKSPSDFESSREGVDLEIGHATGRVPAHAHSAFGFGFGFAGTMLTRRALTLRLIRVAADLTRPSPTPANEILSGKSCLSGRAGQGRFPDKISSATSAPHPASARRPPCGRVSDSAAPPLRKRNLNRVFFTRLRARRRVGDVGSNSSIVCCRCGRRDAVRNGGPPRAALDLGSAVARSNEPRSRARRRRAPRLHR